MAKKIILLSDGTGNSAAKVWRTNVWRVFEALDLTSDEQIACYDDGVGTSSFKPLAILGGGFGWGLKRNVIDLYKFVCRNYSSTDDEIFGFGFSRGAFTIRVVVGLILNQGLIPRRTPAGHPVTEANLDRMARAAYRSYRAEKFHSVLRLESLFRRLRNLFLKVPYDPSKNVPAPTIRFLGLWDTVAAYGLPIEEMTRGVSQWIWPLELPGRTPDSKIMRACHALSLDDERTTFHPVLWNERNEPRVAPDKDGVRHTKGERITQVWFSGVHSNVGGGYPDDSLAQIPLVWMMKEAMDCGLKFKQKPASEPDALVRAESARDKDGRLYDSRHGLGGYYRYGPRKLVDLCHMRLSRAPEDEVEIATPKIHDSVFKRMETNARAYAPIGLPEKYEVVTGDGYIVAPDQYEKPKHAETRVKSQERVWDLVWWRRVVYFLTVAASLYLVLYPLSRSVPRVAKDTTALHPISDALGFLSVFLPNYGNPWFNDYQGDPLRFLIVVALITILMALSSKLSSRIIDAMAAIWHAPGGGDGLPNSLVYRVRKTRGYQQTLRALKRHVAPFVFAMVFIWFGVSVLGHVVYLFEDSFGLFCSRSPDAKQLPQGQQAEISFTPDAFCFGTKVLLENGAKYHVTVRRDPATPWRDGSVETTLAGFRIGELPLGKRLPFVVGWPLKRELIRPWFRVILRFGKIGTFEDYLGPSANKPPGDDTLEETFTARTSDELFVSVNDIALPVPWIYDLFYRNNVGQATITVKRL